MRLALALALTFVCASAARAQKFEGLAPTPPMGWNSWNRFGCDVSERLIRETADAMVATGMKAAGYQYVVIDDCWHGERDAEGNIGPDPARFPSGMKALADYVHSKGLKLGIYSDAGAKTCGGRPGSRGHEYQDALTYARWGVDYLKYDWCNNEGLRAEGAYATMRDALHAAGRPVVFSLCEWGSNKPWEWAKPVGHLWRTTGDITACFDCEKSFGTWSPLSVMRIVDAERDLRAHAGPGRWNDPDMLEVGNGMTESEDRAHFSMWAMLAAPLMAGNDLREMSKATRETLTNAEVVAVDQDALGVQGFRHYAEGALEVWFKPLQGGDWAVCFLNRADAPRPVAYDWKGHGAFTDGLSGASFDPAKTTYRLRDLWAKKSAGTTGAPFNAQVPAHDVVVLRLSK